MDITNLTLDELKALAYDQLKLLSQAQNNINILELEITKRLEQKQNEQSK